MPSKLTLILYGGVLLCVIAIGIVVNGWRNDSHALDGAIKEFKSVIESKDNLIATERDNRRKADERATNYAKRLNAVLLDARNDPLPPVRVRSCPPSAGVPGASPGPAVVAGTPPADDTQENAGDRDIGPELDAFATDAELNLVQCQELQEWVRTTSQPRRTAR